MEKYYFLTIGFQNVLLCRAVDHSDQELDQCNEDHYLSDEENEQGNQVLEGVLNSDNALDIGTGMENRTSITIDVFPWKKESNLDELLIAVKSIDIEGVMWRNHSFVPGEKLKIKCELDIIKVSEDEILEKINDLIDHVMHAEIST